LTLKYQPEAILGSSASDLYRTAFLQHRPFPTEYGTTGDCAWAILHSFDMRLGLTPREMSTFRIHEKSYSPADYAVDDLRGKFFDLATALLRARVATDDRVREQCSRLCVEQVLIGLNDFHSHWQRLHEYRQRRLPWFCNPLAWRTRCLRERSRAQLNDCLNQLADYSATEPLLSAIMRSFIS
jgi:hypothetical protein